MTTKKQQLLDSYETLLTTLDIRIEEDGGLTHDITDTPIILEKKRLCFPSKEILKNLDGKQTIAFHPLSENVYANMSQVLVQLRYMISAKLHRIISGLGYVLAHTTVDQASHAELSDNQMEIIAPLADADAAFLSKYVDLVESLQVQGDPRLVSLYVKRGGILKDKKYTRMVGVSFPLIEHIMTTDDPVINGIKFRKKDLPTLRALFDIIIPEAATLDKYSVGSNSTVAPYLMALLKAYANVLQGTAGIGWDFRSASKLLMGYSLHVKSTLISDLTEGDTSLANFTGLIPALPGNTGDGDINNPETDDGEVKEKATLRESRVAHTPPSFATGKYDPPEPTPTGRTTTTTIAPERPVRSVVEKRPQREPVAATRRDPNASRPAMSSSQRARPVTPPRQEEEAVFIRGQGWVYANDIVQHEIEYDRYGNALAPYDPYEEVQERGRRLQPQHRQAPRRGDVYGGRQDIHRAPPTRESEFRTR